MKSFSHWTPRYVKNRVAEIYYHLICPHHPWLTHDANKILFSLLRNSDTGIEFGSGRSTLFFAKRIRHLISIEHDEFWHHRVQRMLKDDMQINVDYYLVPKDKDENKADTAAYVTFIEQFDSDSIDFVIIDGVYRDFCALKALRVICSGGMLIIDNVNWFLPCNSYSPNSRTFKEGPAGEVWELVYQSISKWRTIWTSSGVTDTAIFFKPCQ